MEIPETARDIRSRYQSATRTQRVAYVYRADWLALPSNRSTSYANLRQYQIRPKSIEQFDVDTEPRGHQKSWPGDPAIGKNSGMMEKDSSRSTIAASQNFYFRSNCVP